MEVYTRTFRVLNGPLIEFMKEAALVNEAARASYTLIIDELGAESTFLISSGQLVGFKFKNPDREKYKRVGNGRGWYPKRNTKEGRALHKRITDIPIVYVSVAGLSSVGLSKHESMVFDQGHVYWPSIVTIPSDPPVAFVRVPWRDEDPDVIAAYRLDSSVRDRDVEPLLWEPTDDMVEIKHWQLEKELDEWNAHVDKVNG